MDRRKKQLQQRRLVKKIFIVWSVLGGIGFVWLVYTVISWFGSLFQDTSSDAKTNPTYTDYMWIEETPKREDEQTGGEEGDFVHVDVERIARREDCLQLYEENKELLVLVNREHALDKSIYENNLRNICNGRLQASKDLYSDLVDLLAAAAQEGHQYWIASAYRSRERQQELVDEDVARYMTQGMSYEEALNKTYEQTMPAGKSEHETGLALDILCSENVNMDLSQALEPGNRWLAENAHKYGFILRYPEGKEEITDIFYEPWHFRYVGKEAAQYLYENELTLEEFHACLNESGQ